MSDFGSSLHCTPFSLYSQLGALPWLSLRRLHGLLTRWTEKSKLFRGAVKPHAFSLSCDRLKVPSDRAEESALWAAEPNCRYVVVGRVIYYTGLEGWSNPSSTAISQSASTSIVSLVSVSSLLVRQIFLYLTLEVFHNSTVLFCDAAIRVSVQKQQLFPWQIHGWWEKTASFFSRWGQ